MFGLDRLKEGMDKVEIAAALWVKEKDEGHAFFSGHNEEGEEGERVIWRMI